MFVAFGRRITFIVLVNIVSFTLCLRQYGSPGDSLYVADEGESTGKMTIINRFSDDEQHSQLERRKRDAAPTTPPAAVAQKNISTWVTIYFLVKSKSPLLL